MPCPLAVRRQRRDAHLALSGVPSAWSRKCPHICAGHPRTPIAARRSMPRRPFHREQKFPGGYRRRENRQLRHHARRCRERSAAGSHLCGKAPRPPRAQYFLERRVIFPTVPGAFGACDLIVRSGNTAYLSILNLAGRACVSRSIATATRTSLTRSFFFTLRPPATRCPKFFAGVDTFVLTIFNRSRSSRMPRWFDRQSGARRTRRIFALFARPARKRARLNRA